MDRVSSQDVAREAVGTARDGVARNAWQTVGLAIAPAPDPDAWGRPCEELRELRSELQSLRKAIEALTEQLQSRKRVESAVIPTCRLPTGEADMASPVVRALPATSGLAA